MDFPHEWEKFPADDFNSAAPRSSGCLTAELLAQVRPNGRFIDHFRFTLGGSKILEVQKPLSLFLPSPSIAGWTFSYQFWPKDIGIRRNMTSSSWSDFREILARREAVILTDDGDQVPIEAVLTELDSSKLSASLRWAVCISEDSNLELQLQTLPASQDSLQAKPAFRG